MVSVMWFRRDLRLADNPALLAACQDGPVLPVFVLDPRLWGPAGPSRRAYLAASLRALDASLRDRGGALGIIGGDPVRRVPLLAREVGAGHVHIAEDFGPYGRVRDDDVEQALAAQDRALVRTGSPYAVSPGRVTGTSGAPYQVFTPFSRAWTRHGWRPPAPSPGPDATWLRPAAGTTDLPDPPVPAGLGLPDAGEEAALRRWRGFLDRVAGYGEDRNRPDLDATSRMSVHLKWGEIHPRTMLGDLSGQSGKGPASYRTELAWREFYADVLLHRPESARDYLKPELGRIAYDEPDAGFAAWREGRTGFPFVDAGMRQLRATGWMHNRVRMVVASFLVKDLHVEWPHGARHFMTWLVDADLASNMHGWQWVAGSGTDPAPYFRIFNPTTQGRRFDPEGAYVRRWVPELADVADPHDPAPQDRQRVGYPEPIVDHATERAEALARYEEIRT